MLEHRFERLVDHREALLLEVHRRRARLGYENPARGEPCLGKLVELLFVSRPAETGREGGIDDGCLYLNNSTTLVHGSTTQGHYMRRWR